MPMTCKTTKTKRASERTISVPKCDGLTMASQSKVYIARQRITGAVLEHKERVDNSLDAAGIGCDVEVNDRVFVEYDNRQYQTSKQG